ncbi:MAG: hypothetical protein AAFQ61_05260 [Cyanobacteria bacterium J06626_23]
MKTARLALTALTVLAGLSLPAVANSGCYLRYPGQNQDLGELCSGEAAGADGTLRLRATVPVVQNVTMAGDFAQGRMLMGEVHNPHARTSDGVTIFYSVQTSEELKTGTLVVSSLDAYATEMIEIDLFDLRGMVESYEFEIL